MRLLLEGIGAILAIAFTLYCIGFVLLSVARFVLAPFALLN